MNASVFAATHRLSNNLIYCHLFKQPTISDILTETTLSFLMFTYTEQRAEFHPQEKARDASSQTGDAVIETLNDQ